MATITRYRDARTGQFVPDGVGERRPASTTTERISTGK